MVVQDVTVLVCDEPSILEEALTKIDLDELPHKRIGTRALMAPREFTPLIVSSFHKVGVYPRVVGGADYQEEE